MNTRLNPHQVAKLLNQSSHQLDDNTLLALAKARNLSLQKQASGVSAAHVLATGKWSWGPMSNMAPQWLATGFIAVVLVFGIGFLQHQHEQQFSDVDVAILTDDLPIEIFVD